MGKRIGDETYARFEAGSVDNVDRRALSVNKGEVLACWVFVSPLRRPSTAAAAKGISINVLTVTVMLNANRGAKGTINSA